MKTIWFVFVLISLTASSAAAQNIYIANSNPGAPGGTGVFTGTFAILDALTAAVDGDMIYVVPSTVTYVGPVIGKSVTLIGTGFHSDVPGGSSSKLDMIRVGADNVRLAGLVVDHIYFDASHTNIMVDKCRTGSIQNGSGYPAANIIIQNCIIGELVAGSTPIYLPGSSSIRISNNIIYTSNYPIEAIDGATIENNVFTGNMVTLAAVTNCNIKNNIFFYAGLTDPGTNGNNVQQNNLSYSGPYSTFSTTNGSTSVNNIEDQDPVFTNFPIGGGSFNFSYDLTLMPGSPAIGTGVGGTDMGIYGGSNPFDVHGTPLPVVREVIAPNTVSQGSNLNVRIQAKGN